MTLSYIKIILSCYLIVWFFHNNSSTFLALLSSAHTANAIEAITVVTFFEMKLAVPFVARNTHSSARRTVFWFVRVLLTNCAFVGIFWTKCISAITAWIASVLFAERTTTAATSNHLIFTEGKIAVMTE